jgi:hypothetical protein
MSGCESITNPVENERLAIKSISKWKVDTLTESKLSRVLFKEFDRLGNIILQEDFSDDGIILTKSTYSHEDSKSFEVKNTFDMSGEVKSEEKVEYEYDVSKRVVKETRYNVNGVIDNIFVFTYDQYGNVTKKTQTFSNSSNEININIDYNYSHTGELVERVTQNGNGNQSRDSISYNSVEKSVVVFRFDANNVLSDKTIYFYNSIGNILNETKYSSDNYFLNKYIYEYEYFLKD